MERNSAPYRTQYSENGREGVGMTKMVGWRENELALAKKI